MPANDDMVRGYMDGYDLDAPEPSANRSYSYRHGFAVGRAEKSTNEPLADYKTLIARANEAMAKDAALWGEATTLWTEEDWEWFRRDNPQ